MLSLTLTVALTVGIGETRVSRVYTEWCEKVACSVGVRDQR